MVLTAFAFAPLGALLEPDATWQAEFVIGALDLKPSQDHIGHTLLHVPWPEVWNGALWTLFYEGMAYVGVGLLAAVGALRSRLRVVVPLLTAAGAALYVLAPPEAVLEVLPGAPGTILLEGARLWTFFGMGMLAYLYAREVRLRWSAVGVALVIFLLVAHLGAIHPPLARAVSLAALPMVVLGLGALLPLRWGSRNDLSYGVYVYAFPVQQLLVLLGIARFGWAVTAVSYVLVTVPLAYASWATVERPALTWKRLVASGRASSGSPG